MNTAATITRETTVGEVMTSDGHAKARRHPAPRRRFDESYPSASLPGFGRRLSGGGD